MPSALSPMTQEDEQVGHPHVPVAIQVGEAAHLAVLVGDEDDGVATSPSPAARPDEALNR